MGGSKTTTNEYKQESTAAPPSWTMPGIQETSKRVTDALATLPGPRYEGPFSVQPAQQDVNGIVDAYTQSAAKAAQLSKLVEGTLGGAMTPYDVGAREDINPLIDLALKKVTQNLQNTVLPGIRSSSLDSGAYSGSRAMGVLPTEAIKNATETGQDVATQIAYDNYQDYENRRLQAAGLDSQNLSMLPGLTDTVMRLGTSQGDLLDTALGVKSAGQQATIDDALARDQYNLTYPFRGLDIATQLLAQLSGNWGTTTANGTSTTTEKTGGIGNVVQGVLGGALGIASGVGALGKGSSLLGLAGKTAPASAAFNTAMPALPNLFKN